MSNLSYTDQQILDTYRQTRQIHITVCEAFINTAFRFLRRKGASIEAADEIVHEAWIPFLRKLPDFELRGEGRLYKYFQRICENKFNTRCQNEAKERKRHKIYSRYVQNDEDNWLEVSTMDEEETWQARKEKLLSHLLKTLKESLRSKCRKLFQYRYQDNLPLEEIDRRMGSKNSKGASSAKNELYRCRKKLKHLLEQVPLAI